MAESDVKSAKRASERLQKAYTALVIAEDVYWIEALETITWLKANLGLLFAAGRLSDVREMVESYRSELPDYLDSLRRRLEPSSKEASP